MNVIIFEMRNRLKSFLIWFTSFLVTMALFFSLYPSFVDGSDTIKQMLKDYPPEMLKGFGVNIGLLTSFVGFYSYVLTYLGMIIFTFACSIGIAMITVEKSGHLNDFIFVKPVSRLKVWLSKVVAAILFSTLFVVLFTVVVLLGVKIANITYDERLFSHVQLGVYLTTLMMTGFGFMVATFLEKVRFPGVVSLVAVMVLFFMKLIVSLSNISNLRYISPLSYFDSSIILDKDGCEIQYVVIALVLTIIFFTISSYRYIKNDAK